MFSISLHYLLQVLHFLQKLQFDLLLIPFGAIMYLFSPSVYSNKAINAVLFGSYSTDTTVAVASNLFLLKSMILYFFCVHLRYNVMVILPSVISTTRFHKTYCKRLFSGLLVVISSKLFTILNLCPGVIGFNFLTDITINYIKLLIRCKISMVSPSTS